jgi:hypothetical protein
MIDPNQRIIMGASYTGLELASFSCSTLSNDSLDIYDNPSGFSASHYKDSG